MPPRIGDDGLPKPPRLLGGAIDQLTAARQRPLARSIDVVDEHESGFISSAP